MFTYVGRDHIDKRLVKAFYEPVRLRVVTSCSGFVNLNVWHISLNNDDSNVLPWSVWISKGVPNLDMNSLTTFSATVDEH